MFLQRRWHWNWRSLQVFQKHLFSNAIKVECRVTRIDVLYVLQPFSDSVDRFVRQLFRRGATSAYEYSNERLTNILVLASGLFSIGAKPRKQVVERFLRQGPFIGHR